VWKQHVLLTVAALSARSDVVVRGEDQALADAGAEDPPRVPTRSLAIVCIASLRPVEAWPVLVDRVLGDGLVLVEASTEELLDREHVALPPVAAMVSV
jgi:hypothetical protein